MAGGLLRARGALRALLAAIEAHRGDRILELDDALVRDAAARCGAPEDAVRAVLTEELDGRFPRLLRGAPAAPGVLALIATCDRLGLPRVVFSDHPALKKLAVRGEQAGWTAVISGRRLGALKPSPDGLWAVAATLGVPLASVLHVGDRWETDGLAAAEAGAVFAHVDDVGWWCDRLLRSISEP
ncbi:MAG: FMN phosphatase YigB (HAD superfamily) [Myxococcota bacterium]|jgi:FMN phosphatase YigB (HAD superfamily)